MSIHLTYYQRAREGYIDAVYAVEIPSDTDSTGWRFGAKVQEDLDAAIQSRRLRREFEFYENAPKELKDEQLMIAFVDDRNPRDKRFIVILQKHVVIIPLQKKEGDCSFAYLSEVKDVMPEYLVIDGEICGDITEGRARWHYSYAANIVFIVEVPDDKSSEYCCRVHEIGLSSLVLNRECSKQEY